MTQPTFGRTDTVPFSVSVVMEALATRAPMTGKELREYTGLPRRTTYTALRRLREQGLLQEKASLRDTRQTYYWLAPSAAALLPARSPAPTPAALPAMPGASAVTARGDEGMVPA